MYVTTIVTRALITTIILGFQISKNTFLMSSPTILPCQGLTPSPPILAVALPHAGKWQYGKSYEMPGQIWKFPPNCPWKAPVRGSTSSGGARVASQFALESLTWDLVMRDIIKWVSSKSLDNATTCSLSNHQSSKHLKYLTILFLLPEIRQTTR